jgi:2-polyprenyl-3-methyl-5-hydroxy-6-metoxy-1,4-benzoquinol methylase
MTVTRRSEKDPDFYSTGGWGYDKATDSNRRYWRERYVEPWGLEPPAKVLDAGCGDGFWSAFFHEAGFDVTAFDISADGICVAEQRHPGPNYLVADADDALSAAWDVFDVVFCRGISHAGKPHTPESQRVVGNLATHLRPAGLLIFTRATNGTGVSAPFTPNPTEADLRSMVEPWLEVERADVYPNEIVIGARKC